MEKLLKEEISRMKFLNKFNPSVVLSEQTEQIFTYPIFGDIKLSTLQPYEQGNNYITVDVSENKIKLIPSPGFGGVADESGKFLNILPYDENIESYFPVTVTQFKYGGITIPKIPFIVKTDGGPIVKSLQIRYKPLNRNKSVQGGLKKIVIGDYNPKTNINPIPGGVLIVTELVGNFYPPIPLTTPPKTTTTIPQITNIKFDIIDPFELDSVKLTDKSLDKLNSEIDVIKKNLKDIIDQNIKIYVGAWSSIDRDSNEKISGNYGPCKGFGDGTIRDYNLCLSQKRSDVIADIIKTKFPEIKDLVVSKGFGETNKFNGKGWTKENPTTPIETAPNRVVRIVSSQPIKKISK